MVLDAKQEPSGLQVFLCQGQVAADGSHPAGQGGGPALRGKGPGVAERAPADHHRVAAGLCLHAQGVRIVLDVAVADHRDAHRLFHRRNHVPVRLAAEPLGPGPTVDDHRGGAGLLGHDRELRGGQIGRVPAAAKLHRHRQAGVRAHCPDDRRGPLRILHQGHAGSFFHHLAHRTAHVQVDQIHRPGVDQGRGPSHGLRIGAEQLQTEGTLGVHGAHQLKGVPLAEDQAVAADHFRDAQCRPMFPAEQAEGQVRVAGQRREHEWGAQPHRADGDRERARDRSGRGGTGRQVHGRKKKGAPEDSAAPGRGWRKGERISCRRRPYGPFS